MFVSHTLPTPTNLQIRFSKPLSASLTRGCWNSRWKHQRLPSCLEFFVSMYNIGETYGTTGYRMVGFFSQGGSGSRYSDVKMNAVLQLQCVALKCHNGNWEMNIETQGVGWNRCSVCIHTYIIICVYIYIVVYVYLRHEGPSQTNCIFVETGVKIRLCGVAFKNGFRRKHLEDDWCWYVMWEKLDTCSSWFLHLL